MVITGMSVVTTLADTLDAFHAALLDGRSGITRWKDPRHANDHSKIGGDMSGYDMEGKLNSLRDRVPAEAFRRMRRLFFNSPGPTEIAMLVAAEAFADAGLFETNQPERIAAILAGHYLYDQYKLANWLAFAADRDDAEVSHGVKEMDTDALACVTEVLGTTGASYSVGGACAAGNVGLRAAMDEIRHHDAHAALAVSSFHELTSASLHSLAAIGVLSQVEFDDEPQTASRPFDAARNGFVPASGAAALMLESLEHASRRGARIYAEILGVGLNTSGARGPTPMEEHTARAMTQALAQAGLNKSDIGYVAAHATSTQLGDLAEAKAICQVFGDHAKKLKVNALKSMLGHQLCAGGLVETVAAVLQLRAGVLYPSINIDRLDPEIDLDVCANRAVEHKVDYLIKNAFGFGGVNSACIIGRFA